MDFDPLWCVKQTSFRVEDNRAYETLFTTGNGHLSVRGCLEEGFEDDPQNVSFRRTVGNISLETPRPGKSKWGTYLPFFMARHPDLGQEMVNLPYFAGLVLCVDGERLNVERGAITGHERWLDLRTGTLHRRLTWRTRSGAVLRVEMERYAHRVRRSLLVQQVRVTAESREVVLEVESAVDSDVRTNGYDHFTVRGGGSSNGGAWLGVETPDGSGASVCVRIEPAEPAWRVRFDLKRAVATKRFDLLPGTPLELLKIGAISTNRDGEEGDLFDRSIDAILAAVGDRRTLRSEHEAAWAEYWREADVVIEGDPRSQLAVRFAA